MTQQPPINNLKDQNLIDNSENNNFNGIGSNNKRNILDELVNYSMNKTKFHIIENNAENILYTVINFMKYLENNFSKEEFEILQKKFFLAIKNKNPSKFTNKIKILKKEKK